MPNEHRIEFGPGEVIRPEYSPDNELIALHVTNAGMASLQEAIRGAGTRVESVEEQESGPEEVGSVMDSGMIDLGMAVLEYEVRVPPALESRESRENPF